MIDSRIITVRFEKACDAVLVSESEWGHRLINKIAVSNNDPIANSKMAIERQECAEISSTYIFWQDVMLANRREQSERSTPFNSAWLLEFIMMRSTDRSIKIGDNEKEACPAADVM